MTCTTYAVTIEKGLAETPGVEQADVSFASEKAIVEYDPSKIDLVKIKHAISQISYGVATNKSALSVGGMACASEYLLVCTITSYSYSTEISHFKWP